MRKIIILASMILALASARVTPQEIIIQADPFPDPPAKKDVNINQYKDEMIEDFENKDEIYDITDSFYNDPEKTDLFLEAYFNTVDFPGLGSDVSIKISEDEYRDKKDVYKKIRGKKYLISSITVKFSQYAQIDEYPTGGLLYKKDYDMENVWFHKSWKKEDLWSKYRWRMAGKKHKSTMILMDGAITIEVPSNEAKVLAGIRPLTRPKTATFMALLKIKETGKDYILVEPVRYMLIWRKKQRVYTNFEAKVKTAKEQEEKKPVE